MLLAGMTGFTVDEIKRVCRTLVLYPYVMVEYGAEPDSVTGDSASKVGQSGPMS